MSLAEGLDSIVFYRSWLEIADRYGNDESSKIIRQTLRYAIYGEIPDNPDDPIADLFFNLVRPNIDSNEQKRINGKKGGAPKGNQNAVGHGAPAGNQNAKKKQTTKQTTNVNVNVNANVNGNDNNNDNVNDTPASGVPPLESGTAGAGEAEDVKVYPPGTNLDEVFKDVYS